MDYTEVLKTLNTVNDLMIKRAQDLVLIEGVKKSYVEGYDFDEKWFFVLLVEDTNYDCPDHFSMLITPEMLEMNDLEWSDFLIKTKDNKIKAFQEKRDAEEKARLNIEKERDEKEYIRLKEKLWL